MNFKTQNSSIRVGTILLILCLCCLSLLFPQCSPDSNAPNKSKKHGSDSENYSDYKSLIKEYPLAEKRYPTSRIVFSGDHEAFLLSGWSQVVKTPRWAEGLRSELCFVSRKSRPVTMKLRCRPFQYGQKLKQTVEIFLNKKFVNKIALQPGTGEYEVVLPEKHLTDGLNHLTFKYAYARKPCETLKSQDCRNLSVQFSSISFIGNETAKDPIEVVDGKIRQPAGTGASFHYYLKVPRNCLLNVTFNPATKDCSGRLEVREDDPSTKKVVSFDKRVSEKIDLSDYADRIIELSFWADRKPGSPSQTDSPDNYVTWSDLRLVTLNGKNVSAQKNQSTDSSSTVKHDFGTSCVIYLVFDAFHADHASLYGYHRKTTPFLDQLADNAVVFDNMFANAPSTLPSTGTLFTSTYSHEHGLVDDKRQLSPILPTIAELLTDANIETYLISDHPYLTDTWGLTRGFKKVYHEEQYSLNPEKTIEALESIGLKDANHRKFIYIHLIPPHSPYLPPQEFRIFMAPEPGFIEPTSENLLKIDSGKIKINEKQLAYIASLYDANILFADHIAKRLCEYLEDSGIIDHCILIITSDHGEALKEHGRMLHNTTVFDEMIHVPFLVRFPERLGIKKRRLNSISSLLDMAPTIAAFYGVNRAHSFRGRSLVPLFFGGFVDIPFVYSETMLTNERMIRDSEYKLMTTPREKRLFNIREDESETENLLGTLPVTGGYYGGLIQPMLDQRNNLSKNRLDSQKLNDIKLKKLRDLGYIK